ncbi:hypothetical protein ACSVDA_20455 [Cytobacillus sp. Hm23]
MRKFVFTISLIVLLLGCNNETTNINNAKFINPRQKTSTSNQNNAKRVKVKWVMNGGWRKQKLTSNIV